METDSEHVARLADVRRAIAMNRGDRSVPTLAFMGECLRCVTAMMGSARAFVERCRLRAHGDASQNLAMQGTVFLESVQAVARVGALSVAEKGAITALLHGAAAIEALALDREACEHIVQMVSKGAEAFAEAARNDLRENERHRIYALAMGMFGGRG